MADVLEASRRVAEARQVRLDMELEAATAYVDPTALRQVLTNLVENAVRYTTAGEGGVRSERAADGVWLRVRDTGVGIPAEHLGRIFERFYRVDPARSRAEGGTGLGLAIVKHLVEAHGGRVQATSDVGVGTLVSVWLPAR